MNCEEFRRKLLEDPHCQDPEFLAHRDKCLPCREEEQAVNRLESGLEKLLNVRPPPDLKGSLQRIPRRRHWLPVALAASLAGMAALGAWWMATPVDNGNAVMVAEVLHHIKHEPRHLSAAPVLTAGAWKAISPRVQVDTDDWNHKVTYAAPCEMMGERGLHLILAGDEGPVSVLVIVDQHVGESRLFHEARHRGVLRPLKNGMLAVVSANGRPVDDLAAEIAPRIKILA